MRGDTAKVDGEAIKRLRAERKWTQAELARRVGCDRRRVQELENGEKGGRAKWETIRDFAEALGVEVEDLKSKDSGPQAIHPLNVQHGDTPLSPGTERLIDAHEEIIRYIYAGEGQAKQLFNHDPRLVEIVGVSSSEPVTQIDIKSNANSGEISSGDSPPGFTVRVGITQVTIPIELIRESPEIRERITRFIQAFLASVK